jgi:SAM-dependent methyltransferase
MKFWRTEFKSILRILSSGPVLTRQHSDMGQRELWNRYSCFFNAEENTVFPPDLREMDFYRNARLQFPGDCLEIGAGSGRLARALLNTGTTFALEPSDSMLSSWSSSDMKLAQRVQGTGETMPFKPASFQLVCFPYNGLQCVLDRDIRQQLIYEAYRVTAPEGVFILEISPVFSRRNEEPLTERYKAALTDGSELVLREKVERCPSTGNIRYHMFYTVNKDGSSNGEEVVLELASIGFDEICLMIDEAGFRKYAIFGDYDLSEYDPDLSPRLLVRAEKVV